MQKKIDFTNWLLKNTNLSISTTGKYSSAISTISKGLMKYDLVNKSLYYIDDPILLESLTIKYLAVPEFSEKDLRGNRMYSNALKYFLSFTKSTYLDTNHKTL